MYARLEKIVYRASWRNEFSRKSAEGGFSTPTPLLTNDRGSQPTFGVKCWAEVAGLRTERWLRLRQTAQKIGRPLTCPLCQFRFEYRHHFRSARACPRCKVALGFPFYYRVILSVVGLCPMGWSMYRFYVSMGPNGLLLAMPVGLVLALLAQIVVLRAFPPKLQAYAESDTWLKLT